MKTKMTEILGIKYPIMQGGMQHLGVPELAAAVSNAGGLGTINVTIFPDLEDFRQAVRKTKKLTDKPFCVNISMLPHVSVGERNLDYINICAEEGVAVIETAGRNPIELVEPIKKANMKLIHKVPMAKYALKAQEIGADLVTVIGYEAAGHPSMDEIGSMVIGNKTSEIVDIPVILGGGIVDGKGLAAALALGAEGVVMGTRFVATKECTVHPNFKNWIIQSNETDSITCQRSLKNMARVAKNKAALNCLEMEKNGATLEELMTVISGKNSKEAYVTGNVDGGLFPVGTGIGSINEILSAEELISSMVQQANSLR